MIQRNILLEMVLVLFVGYAPSMHAMLSKFQRSLDEFEVSLYQKSADLLLLNAAEVGDLDLIKHCVEKLNANRNACCNIGYTARHNAALNGHLPVLKYLLQGYDYPEDQFDDEITPFHLALKGDHLDIVKWYCEEKGVNIYHTDDKGVNLLHLATFHNSIKCLQYLIKKTAGAKHINRVLHESFGIACKNELINCAKILLPYVDIDEPTDPDTNMTLLYYLVGTGRYEGVKFLMENGANPELRTREGFSPIEAARAQNFPDIVEYLEKYSLSKKLQAELMAPKDKAIVHKKTAKIIPVLKPVNGEVHADDTDCKVKTSKALVGKENNDPQILAKTVHPVKKQPVLSVNDCVHICEDKKGYKKSSIFLFSYHNKTAFKSGTYYSNPNKPGDLIAVSPLLDNIGTKLSHNHLANADYSEHVKSKMLLFNDIFHNFSQSIDKQYGDSACTKVIDFKLYPEKKAYWEKQIGNSTPVKNRWFELHVEIPAQIRPAGFSLEKAKKQGPTGKIKYVLLAEGLADHHPKTIVHRCFEIDNK